jgi:hypothetical protein
MTDRRGVLFSGVDGIKFVEHAEVLGCERVWTAESQGKTAFGKLER